MRGYIGLSALGAAIALAGAGPIAAAPAEPENPREPEPPKPQPKPRTAPAVRRELTKFDHARLAAAEKKRARKAAKRAPLTSAEPSHD